jgi:hypothetical protein
MVYQVIDDQLIVAVGKRERSEVYHLASEKMRWRQIISGKVICRAALPPASPPFSFS